MDELIEIQKELRKIPVIELYTPTVVLVGAPNVGKSSIVKTISSGNPEVNNYPFTTRGMTVGHIVPSITMEELVGNSEHSRDSMSDFSVENGGIREINSNSDADKSEVIQDSAEEFSEETRTTASHSYVDDYEVKRYQVMDTPGLLDRPEEERNEMEKLTFASLAHLPTAVIFVIDPTGLSGDKSTLTAQLNVRNYLKSRFPLRPWIDVISKSDVVDSTSLESTGLSLPDDAMKVSVKSGDNVEELKHEVEVMLLRLKEILIDRGLLKT